MTFQVFFTTSSVIPSTLPARICNFHPYQTQQVFLIQKNCLAKDLHKICVFFRIYNEKKPYPSPPCPEIVSFSDWHFWHLPRYRFVQRSKFYTSEKPEGMTLPERSGTLTVNLEVKPNELIPSIFCKEKTLGSCEPQPGMQSSPPNITII